MGQTNRNTLKGYFETGDKPTQAQFEELIDSMFCLAEDGGAKVKQLLEALSETLRLKKNAVRGADFALNRRGKGDIMNATFQSGMTNLLKGDFWIYSDGTPGEGDPVALGDWVIAMRDGFTPPFDFQNTADWQIVHFGDTTVNQQTLELHHYRVTPSGETETLTISDIHAQVVSISINHLTYYGKYNDGNYAGYDFMYSYEGANTVISINSGMLGFPFMNSMQVDILYILIPQ